MALDINQSILVHIIIISVIQLGIHGETRLVGGGSPNMGRVEVYYLGKWGTVKGNSWDLLDCRVTCRELSFGEPLGCFEDSERFGMGIGRVVWFSVHCVGNEGLLTECDREECFGCEDHSQDVGVHCDVEFPGGEQNGDVRLVDGREPYEGRLEVFYGGEWGTVCDHEWDLRDSDVACRMLGYGCGQVAKLNISDHGQGRGLIMLTDVDCHGYEETLSDCSHSRWLEHDCEHHEDVGIGCASPEMVSERGIRLFNGTTSMDTEGRVEIYHNQTWGSICADHWGMADSVVVCRQLAFSGALAAVTDGTYGDSDSGSDGMTLNRVSCFGTEGQILECSYSSWYFSNCSSRVEAAVVCDTTPVGTYQTGDARNLPDSNVVEVYYAGAWGTICPLNWNIDDGDVICRGINQSYAWKVSEWFNEENITSDVIVTNVGCNGNEGSIVECDTGEWYFNSCTSESFASVYCTENETARIRLVGGSVPNEGRLEVFYGEWGSVCDEEFDLFDSQVVCRELGYRRAFAVRKGAYFGEGTGQVWFERLDCTGRERTVYNCQKSDWGVTECSHARDVGVICVPDHEEEDNHLSECDHDGWYQHDCTHDEDVGVRCYQAASYRSRLRNGPDPTSGRVEVFEGGTWHAIALVNFTYIEANVVCRQRMFYGGAISVHSEPSPDVGEYVPYFNGMFTCTGKEYWLEECAMTPVDVTDITDGFEPAFVTCRETKELKGGQIAAIVIVTVTTGILIVGIVVFISTRNRR